jgi:hypothetical protein
MYNVVAMSTFPKALYVTLHVNTATTYMTCTWNSTENINTTEVITTHFLYIQNEPDNESY